MARQFAILPFRALQDHSLHPSDKLVLAALGAHTDTTGRCWPSIAKLMDLSGLRERTVQRSIKRLEVGGYVEVERRDGRSTKFRVLFDTGAIESPPPLEGVTPVASGTHNVGSNGNTSSPALAAAVEKCLAPYLRSARYPHAVRAGVAMLLNPEAFPHYPEAVVCQALTEMQGAGKPFKQSTLAHWCQNLAQGPLPPRGRTNGPRGARFSYLTAPDPQEGA